MKVIDIEEVKRRKFGDLSKGDCFKCDNSGIHYMKIDAYDRPIFNGSEFKRVNAVCLQTGDVVDVTYAREVTPLYIEAFVKWGF